MSKLNGIGLDTDVSTFRLIGSGLRSKAAMAVITFGFACGSVHATSMSWPDSQNQIQNSATELAGNKNALSENQSTANMQAVFLVAPEVAAKLKFPQIIENASDSDESPISIPRILAMLLVGVALVSLRIRGMADRSNKVH
ncbi:MAG: hypothetical protein ACXWJE_09165 [Burkholderiaceae bacterium]